MTPPDAPRGPTLAITAAPAHPFTLESLVVDGIRARPSANQTCQSTGSTAHRAGGP